VSGTFTLPTMRCVSSDRLPAGVSAILRLDCRLDGRDCYIGVGKPLPSGEGVVVAILDRGREQVFDVRTISQGRDVVRVGRHVCAVTELPEKVF
jgi:hypothetical protein